MKLVLKWLHNDAYSGPALFDESGEMLPCQHACSVDGRVGEATQIVARFYVDRKSVVIEDDSEELWRVLNAKP